MKVFSVFGYSLVCYLQTIIGLAMLVGAYYCYSKTNEFVSSALTAEGEVVDLKAKESSDGDTYSPVVKFNAKDGSEHQIVSNVSSDPPAYSIGEAVEVLYEEANPQNAKINAFFSLHLPEFILSLLGGIFFLIGAGMLLVPFLKNKKRDYLKANGIPIQAKFQEVHLNTSYGVNDRNPYNIVCQWLNPSTNEVIEFKSENIWFNPKDYIHTEFLTVLIERNNPKKYWMDTSFLPKKG